MKRWFVAVAVPAYDDPAWSDRPCLSEAVEIISDIFAGLGYQSLLPQLREGVSRTFLDEFYEGLADLSREDLLVVYYTGHGVVDAGHHRLVVSNSYRDKPHTAILTADLAALLVRAPPRQVLLLLDCCASGAGAANAQDAVEALVHVPVPGEGLWMLATTWRKDSAVASAFPRALRDAVDGTCGFEPTLSLHEVLEKAQHSLGARQTLSLRAPDVVGEAPFFPNVDYSNTALTRLFRRLPPKPSPAHLLDARYRVVPFDWSVRCAERRFLREWCFNNKEQVSFLCLTGRGGGGKTRMLGEWCDELETLGWRTGFIEKWASCAETGQILNCSGSVMIVIDYAERRTPEWLHERLLLMAETKKPEAVRVVLLSRDKSGWWDIFCKNSKFSLKSELEKSRMIEISGGLRNESKQRLHASALKVFAEGRSKALDAGLFRPQNLWAVHFDRPLYIQMRALAYIENVGGDGHSVRARLIGVVLEKEREFWVSNFRGGFESMRSMERFSQHMTNVVAAITLLGGVSLERNGLSLIKDVWSVSGGSGSPPVSEQDLWDFLRQVQPMGNEGVRGLEPDLLGEVLVEESLNAVCQSGDFLEKIFCNASSEQCLNGFGVLLAIYFKGDSSNSRHWVELMARFDTKVRGLVERALVPPTKQTYISDSRMISMDSLQEMFLSDLEMDLTEA